MLHTACFASSPGNLLASLTLGKASCLSINSTTGKEILPAGYICLWGLWFQINRCSSKLTVQYKVVPLHYGLYYPEIFVCLYSYIALVIVNQACCEVDPDCLAESQKYPTAKFETRVSCGSFQYLP